MLGQTLIQKTVIGIAGFFLIFSSYSFCIDPIKNIDAIYLINLDRRPDRLAAAAEKLAKYGIEYQRFSAIDGRQLSYETLLEIGFIYAENMSQERWATTPKKNGNLEYAFLDSSMKNKIIFSEWMTPGAIGCALSHLSVLKEAYAAGYETIWVLEDDIHIEKDPKVLETLISELDVLTKETWDILYTDPDPLGDRSLPDGSFWWMWRPDLCSFDVERFTKRMRINDNFIQVGSKDRTHSMVIRRSGIKKILDHVQTNHLYLPIDQEIGFTPHMIAFMTSYPIVTYDDSYFSDIQNTTPQSYTYGNSEWELYKQSHLEYLPRIRGWCNTLKANHLMDFIYTHQPEVCVEIGTFGGSTTFPLILAMQYLNKGHLYTIDAWDRDAALEGMNIKDLNYSWWSQVDFLHARNTFFRWLKAKRLHKQCTILESLSQKAVDQFEDGSIDMLYIDGNSSKLPALQDVIAYFPKVKENGFIWVNDANTIEKLPSIAFLNDHAVFLADKSLKNTCVVFQKK